MRSQRVFVLLGVTLEIAGPTKSFVTHFRCCLHPLLGGPLPADRRLSIPRGSAETLVSQVSAWPPLRGAAATVSAEPPLAAQHFPCRHVRFGF